MILNIQECSLLISNVKKILCIFLSSTLHHPSWCWNYRHAFWTAATGELAGALLHGQLAWWKPKSQREPSAQHLACCLGRLARLRGQWEQTGWPHRAGPWSLVALSFQQSQGPPYHRICWTQKLIRSGTNFLTSPPYQRPVWPAWWTARLFSGSLRLGQTDRQWQHFQGGPSAHCPAWPGQQSPDLQHKDLWTAQAVIEGTLLHPGSEADSWS